jgi:hypothetical protein
MKNKKGICLVKNWSIMICENCKNEREQKDFLLNQPYCCRCMYELKLKAYKKRISSEKQHKICRNCNKEFGFDKDLKQRQRDVYCSLECALKGHIEIRNNYWTRKLV